MQNFLDPAILFFVFGLLAGAIKSNLEIPQPIARFLSLYLLMALGLKGGFALARSGLTAEVAISLGCALLLAVAIPTLGYLLLTRLVSRFDAAAIAANPLYKILAENFPDLLGSDAVKWNFTKFLVDRNGTVLKRFEPTVTPEEIEREIQSLLA